MLGQDLLVNPSTKRLQVEGAPVADNSGFAFLPALSHGSTVVLNGATTLLLELTGTWAGTVSFEASPDSQNWYAAHGQRPDAATMMVASRTVAGVWVFSVGGFLAIPRQIQCVHFRHREGDGRDVRQRQVCNHDDGERNGWRHGIDCSNHWL